MRAWASAIYAMRLRSNSRLDETTHAICLELPKINGAVAFREFQHAVKSWGTARRGVKFQVPETKDAAAPRIPRNRPPWDAEDCYGPQRPGFQLWN